MRFTITRENLQHGLAAVGASIPARTTLPVLSNILVEADAETEHQPVVDADGECICLAAVEGRLRLGGFLGRLLQPLTGA